MRAHSRAVKNCSNARCRAASDWPEPQCIRCWKREAFQRPANAADTSCGAWRRTAPYASARDRKSTRLNSSHLGISYAVFCLKKKKNNKKYTQERIDMTT